MIEAGCGVCAQEPGVALLWDFGPEAASERLGAADMDALARKLLVFSTVTVLVHATGEKIPLGK